jgi:non-ribosomal peptide synthase protein (TIGR01720 family)
VIVAGEACEPEVAKMHFERLPQARLYNEYGPSESTVWATVEEITAEATGPIPIGKPIANTQVYILDPDLQPVPPGIPGEIFIGGMNIARGYIHNEQATEERFIANPFENDGGRLYRTGDLGKYRSDGKIIFLGRVDEQVKLRGHRIEMGEIEQHVAAFNCVEECAALLVEGKGGVQRIVCFYTQEENVDQLELRAYLRSGLPVYMVPSDLVLLDAMPRLPNGKLDSRKLREQKIDSGREAGEQPGNAAEKVLHQIWTEVLKRDAIGIHDNFFEIGGDSISSIRILSMARNRGFNMKPHHLFEYQTIAELAEYIPFEIADHAREKQGFVGESVSTPFQQHLLSSYGKGERSGMEAFTVQLSQNISETQILQAVQALVERHAVLRQTFGADDTWRTVNYRVFKTEDYVERIAAIPSGRSIAEVIAPFDLREGPLFKVILWAVDDGSRHHDSITLAAHRAILDNRSWALLLKQFIVRIGAIAEDAQGQSPHQQAGFKDWGESFHTEQNKSAFNAQLKYWKDVIDAEDGDRRVVAGSKDIRVDSLTTRSLSRGKIAKEVLDAYNLEVHELLNMAFAMSIDAYLQKAEFVVWTEADGRTGLKSTRDLDAVAGNFTVHFPVRVQLKSDIRGTVIHIKESYRALPLSGLGYDYLRYVAGEHVLDAQERFYFSCTRPVFDAVSGPIQSVERVAPANLAESFNTGNQIRLHCNIESNNITCHFAFDGDVFDANAADVFLADYARHLEELIEHCAQAGKQYTPGDFPDAGLSQDDLDNLLGQL